MASIAEIDLHSFCNSSGCGIRFKFSVDGFCICAYYVCLKKLCEWSVPNSYALYTLLIFIILLLTSMNSIIGSQNP